MSSVKVGQAKTFHFSSAALGDTRAPAAPAPAPLPPTHLPPTCTCTVRDLYLTCSDICMAHLVMILFFFPLRYMTREGMNAEKLHVGQDNVQNFCDEIEEKSICKYMPTSLRYLSLPGIQRKREFVRLNPIIVIIIIISYKVHVYTCSLEPARPAVPPDGRLCPKTRMIIPILIHPSRIITPIPPFHSHGCRQLRHIHAANLTVLLPFPS